MKKIKKAIGLLMLLAPIFKDSIGDNFSLFIVFLGVVIIISTSKKEDKVAMKKELIIIIPILILFIGAAFWVLYMT